MADQGTGLQHLCNTKIAEEQCFISTDQHVLRFHIAVNGPLIVSILQCLHYLLSMGKDGRQGEPGAAGIAIAQSAP